MTPIPFCSERINENLKKIQGMLYLKGPILSGGPPASYKTLIKVSCHLQHSFLEIHLYYVEGAYINRPARSKAAGLLEVDFRPIGGPIRQTRHS
eukprot:COSAG01_NODE_712_length_14100_cov_12.382758_4_plen_94_part_00